MDTRSEYQIIVKPRSSRNKVEQVNDTLTVWTTKPAHDGEANKAVIEQISDYLNIPKTRVSIIRGLKSKVKTIKIS